MFAALAAIFTAFLSYAGVRLTAFITAAAAFGALVLAFSAGIDAALDFTVPSLPSWAVVGFALLPENTPVYVGAYVAALAARRVYDLSAAALSMKV